MSAQLRCHSFAPVARADARILILGSMPGEASLAAQQYYAHPRNQFWRIIAGACGIDAELPYGERLEHLQAHGLALWDVLASCERRGSLDSAIEHHTAVANDVPGLLQRCRGIRRICCNGGTAFAALRRSFAAQLVQVTGAADLVRLDGVEVLRLPSTSPANASWSPVRKLEAWCTALAPRGGATPSAR
jgi:hypoxanthine-DNA glycosylase